MLLGSVTHAVIRDASCPVILVPRGTHNALVRAAGAGGAGDEPMTAGATPPGGPRIDDARPGDWIAVDAIGGGPSRRGQILAVLGAAGHRHFRVRWDEEHESLHFPAQGTRLIPEEQLEHPA